MWHTRTSTEVDFPMLTDIANTDLWVGSSGLAQMGIGYSTQKQAGFLKPGWYLWIETSHNQCFTLEIPKSRDPGRFFNPEIELLKIPALEKCQNFKRKFPCKQLKF